MKELHESSQQKSERVPGEEKILLALLPFWDPQIPPLGIACLKGYLKQHHYQVKTVDLNLDLSFRNVKDNYFNLLERNIPYSRRGNLRNIGNQVLRNHLMAHLNYQDEETYIKLLEILIDKTFFCKFPTEEVKKLTEMLTDFYSILETYFTDLLEREKPSVLGLSVYGDTLAPSLFAFQLAKKMDPAIKTVMGGGIFADQLAPGSPELDYFVEKTEGIIDKLFIGEGEGLFLKFLRGEMDEAKRVYSLRDVNESVINVSTLPSPDFSDLDTSYYPHLAFYGARSCPFQCKFCSETVNWGKYRKKKPGETVKGFIELYERYACQLFLLTDSTLNPTAGELSREVINSGKSIYWDGFLRADKHVCKTENTLLWRRGGFYRAKLGLESGSQRILDLMDKCITIEQSETALACLAYAGIKTTTFWLFGFPGETEEDFQETLDFVERNKDNIYEADCNAFNYYLTGQANSDEWQKNNKGILLYPPWARDMLITQTWVLDCDPTREEAYQRLNRFIEHCRKIGIPNPYSLNDVFKADERWCRLHKNAVPPLVELRNEQNYIDETMNVKELVAAPSRNIETEDFDF